MYPDILERLRMYTTGVLTREMILIPYSLDDFRFGTYSVLRNLHSWPPTNPNAPPYMAASQLMYLAVKHARCNDPAMEMTLRVTPSFLSGTKKVVLACDFETHHLVASSASSKIQCFWMFSLNRYDNRPWARSYILHPQMQHDAHDVILNRLSCMTTYNNHIQNRRRKLHEIS